MKRLRATIVALSLVPAAALNPGAAWSSACNEEKVVEIHMTAGGVCWDYRGNATTFRGKFAGGQNVEVRMSGESAQYDPSTKKDVVSWEARSPTVEGPDKFFAEAKEDSGTLTFRTPASGIYRIGFSPCAMWGGKGEVHICTR
jgi:hypothetical protein